MSKITDYTALTSAATSDVLVIVDVSDTTQSAAGTTKQITLANLQEGIDNDTDTNIQPAGAQASGSVGLNSDAGHVHPATGLSLPVDNGFLAWNFPAMQATGTFLNIASSLYLMKVFIRQPFTATNLNLFCSTAGSGTSTTSFCGIWNSSGTLLTSSADIGSTFVGGSATGIKALPWVTPQALTVSMGFVWVGWVFNLSVTQPTLRGLNSPGSNGLVAINAGLSNATLAACINGTAVGSLANITPSSNTQGGSQPAAMFAAIT